MRMQLGVADGRLVAVPDRSRRLVGRPLAGPAGGVTAIRPPLGAMPAAQRDGLAVLVLVLLRLRPAGQSAFQFPPRDDRIVEAHAPLSNRCLIQSSW